MVELVKRDGQIMLDNSAVKDLLSGVEAMKKANSGYNVAEQYYLGTRPEWFASLRYRIALAYTGTTYRMNFAKTPVDALTDRLEINTITCPDAATTAQLKKVLDANQFDLESLEVHLRAGEFGDAYLLIWPNDDSDEEVEQDDDDAHTISAQRMNASGLVNQEEGLNEDGTEQDDDKDESNGTIDMFYNDPRTMRLFYDVENPRQKSYAIKRWKSGSVFRVNLFYTDRIEKWVSRTDAVGDTAADWAHFDDGTGVWPTPNTYGRIPVFHFRNARPYGLPEHIQAYGAQDAITKIVVTHMTTMDYHGFPQRWALSGNDVDDDNDLEDFGLDEQDDTDDDSGLGTAGGQNRTSVHAEPGHLWILKNIKQIGQFEASKSDVFLAPFDTYVRAMAQLSTTPLHYFDPSGGTPSGESLRVADAPMVKKTKNRQLSYGGTWKDACEFILLLLGYPTPDGAVQISWENPAATDDLLTWDVALYKRAIGVPVRQILLEAGYTAEQCDEWGVPESKFDPEVSAVTKGLPNLRSALSTQL